MSAAVSQDAVFATSSTRCVMLIRRPFKRVYNRTMAWGLEAGSISFHELVELAAPVPELKIAPTVWQVASSTNRALNG